MKKDHLKAQTSITIHAPVEKVWNALINPKIVKDYMFGANLEADWKVGGKIRYTGEYEGKPYEEKGEIKQIEPKKILQTTNFSSMTGQDDKPENYALVTYRLKETGDKTKISVSQDSIKNRRGLEKSTANWKGVLKGLKQTVEGK